MERPTKFGKSGGLFNFSENLETSKQQMFISESRREYERKEVIKETLKTSIKLRTKLKEQLKVITENNEIDDNLIAEYLRKYLVTK